MYPNAITKPRLITLFLLLLIIALPLIKPLPSPHRLTFMWCNTIGGVLLGILNFFYPEKKYILRHIVMSVLIVGYFIYRYILYP